MKNITILKPILIFLLVLGVLHEVRIRFFSEPDNEIQNREDCAFSDFLTNPADSTASKSLSITADSARFSLQCQRWETLSDSAKEKQSWETAYHYLQQSGQYKDSLLKQEEAKRSSLSRQLNHLQTEISTLHQELRKKKKSINLFFNLGVCFVLPFCGLVGFIFYRRKKRKQQMERMQRIQYFQDRKYWESMEQLELNKQEITRLEERLHQTELQADAERNQTMTLQTEIERLKNQNKHIELQKVRNQVSLELLHQSEVYQFIFRNIGNVNVHLSERHWKQLGEDIDTVYEQFTSRLYAICPKLNEVELHVCYLLKLSVPLSDIAHFTAHQKNSISSLRERLYKKIHGTKGNGKALDQFILDF